MNVLARLWFKAKTGNDIVDLGRADETVIRYKDKYISVLENPEGEIVSLGWFESISMTQEAVRDFWLATPPLGLGFQTAVKQTRESLKRIKEELK